MRWKNLCSIIIDLFGDLYNSHDALKIAKNLDNGEKITDEKKKGKEKVEIKKDR